MGDHFPLLQGWEAASHLLWSSYELLLWSVNTPCLTLSRTPLFGQTPWGGLISSCKENCTLMLNIELSELIGRYLFRFSPHALTQINDSCNSGAAITCIKQSFSILNVHTWTSWGTSKVQIHVAISCENIICTITCISQLLWAILVHPNLFLLTFHRLVFLSFLWSVIAMIGFVKSNISCARL